MKNFYVFLFVLISFCFCSTPFAEENLFEDINKYSPEEYDDSMFRWMKENNVILYVDNLYDAWFARNAYNKDLDLQLNTNPCEKLHFLPECSKKPNTVSKQE